MNNELVDAGFGEWMERQYAAGEPPFKYVGWPTSSVFEWQDPRPLPPWTDIEAIGREVLANEKRNEGLTKAINAFGGIPAVLVTVIDAMNGDAAAQAKLDALRADITANTGGTGGAV